MSLSQFHEDPDRVSDSNQWLSQERKNYDKFLFLLGSEKILVDNQFLKLGRMEMANNGVGRQEGCSIT